MNKNRKGFTLAELLILVAVIGVLVAISIPVFSNRLERSREATDLANVRGKYAQIMSAAITEEEPQENAGFGRSGENGCYTYTAEVPLKQQEKGWQTKEILTVGSVSSSSPDKGQYWLNEPEKGSVCVITYRQGDTKPTLNWCGKFYDYVAAMRTASVTLNNKSNCLNANNTGSGTIQKLLCYLTDPTTREDIKTWAAVRDPADGQDTSAYNYIFSTVDITGLGIGTKIPAMYADKNGSYSVGYATVNKAPDGNYKVITVSPEGTYPCNNSDGKRKEYDENYRSSSLLSNKTDYASGAAAQEAYWKLVEAYQAQNS